MNNNEKPIMNLSYGEAFTFDGNETVYVVTRPVSTAAGMTRVDYMLRDSAQFCEFTFSKPSLSTAKVV